MPFYRILLRGENFVIWNEEGWELVGFYANRWVQAPNPNSAEMRVIEQMRKDPQFQKPEGYQGGPEAKVFVDEIKRLRMPPLRRPLGCTYYPMGC